MSKCHKRWNKERSSLCLRQLEEALCCAVNAFGNNCQQGKVFSFWFSWAWGLKDMKLSQVIINTPATCTRWDHWSQWHRPWCLGNTLSNGPAISPQHHTPLTSLQQGFLHLFIWMLDSPESVYTENHDSPLVASTRNWKRTGHMMARTQCPGKGLDHSIQCVCYGNKGIVSPGEGRQGEKMLFHSWRYLKCLKPSDRVVACCADRSQHVDMTCITTAKRFPKTREKVSILSAGLTLLSNALMLNQSNWVWAQQNQWDHCQVQCQTHTRLQACPRDFHTILCELKSWMFSFSFCRKSCCICFLSAYLEHSENPQSISHVKITCVSLINIWKLLMLYRKYCLSSSFLSAQESKHSLAESWKLL